MAENSAISWTDDTFNPWIGCTKISPACDGCYAEAWAKRYRSDVEWGAPGDGAGTRHRTAPANWRKPLKWDREAKAAGTPRFVFCASLADVFDNEVPAEWRRDLFDLIRATTHLTWLLLTKRPGNIKKLFGAAMVCAPTEPDASPRPDLTWPRNAALLCTIANQEEADRDLWKLIDAKEALNPAFIGVSMEPLLGPVDLENIQRRPNRYATALGPGRLDWVITGGETDQGGHKARETPPDWFRCIRDQCHRAGVTYHHKQMTRGGPIPPDLQVQDRPEVRRV